MDRIRAYSSSRDSNSRDEYANEYLVSQESNTGIRISTQKRKYKALQKQLLRYMKKAEIAERNEVASEVESLIYQRRDEKLQQEQKLQK